MFVKHVQTNLLFIKEDSSFMAADGIPKHNQLHFEILTVGQKWN